MRSAPLVGALEAVAARLAAGLPGGNRQLVATRAAARRRAGRGCWRTGRRATAGRYPSRSSGASPTRLRRLYNERSLLKYDTRRARLPVRRRDRADPPGAGAGKPWQGDLFALRPRPAARPGEARRRRRCAMLRRQRRAAGAAGRRGGRAVLLDAERLARGRHDLGGRAVAGWLHGLHEDARLWSALIPSMGYMALLRNLRNFDEAGRAGRGRRAGRGAARRPGRGGAVAAVPVPVPGRLRAAPSLRWGHALDRALQPSLANLPALPGRTLILVDTSASMAAARCSRRSTMTPGEGRGACSASRSRARGEQVDLYGFADGVFPHPVQRGGSVLQRGRAVRAGASARSATARRSPSRSGATYRGPRPGRGHPGHADDGRPEG